MCLICNVSGSAISGLYGNIILGCSCIVNGIQRQSCVCVCFSESLLVHLWHSSAALPGLLSSDWLHHGLENEGE